MPGPASPISPTSRLVSLVRLLLRYGRSDLVSDAGLDGYADGSSGDPATAESFAADLESMGPTYVKLGQLLSTRFDLLPPAYTTALTRLQDEVEPIEFEQVRETVESELGGQLRHLFASFEEVPLASASLGQVHRAVTPTGREVVVKVQRPGIREVVEADMRVLTRLAGLADRRTASGRALGLEGLARQFERSLALELDYRREARNLVRFAELTERFDRLVVPEPVEDLSTGRVLTMTYLEGRKVTDVGPLGLLDLDTGPVVEQLFEAYLTSILGEGFLHADPHPGNLLLTPDGRLGLLDLGMVAHVPPRIQTRVLRLLAAIGDADGERVAAVLADLGRPLEGYDGAAFREDVTHLVTEAVAQGASLEAGTVLVQLSRVSGAHGLRPPPEMALVGKALLNLDQSVRHLDPDFEPAVAIRAHVGTALRDGLTTSPGHLVAAALDAKEFTSQLPRRANRILEALAEGTLQLKIDALDEERLHTVLQRIATRVTLGLVLAAMIVGAALLIQVPTAYEVLGYPALAIAVFLLAVLGGTALMVWILVTDRRVARTERRSPPVAPPGA